MKIVAVNTGHNGSICYVDSGKVVYYAEEERLTRIKHDGNPMQGLLEVMKLTDEIDYLVIGGTVAHPALPWNGYDVFTALLKKSPTFKDGFQTVYAHSIHHLGHASNAFYNSGLDEALVMVIDGAGSYNENMQSWEMETVYKFSYEDAEIIFQKQGSMNRIDEQDGVIVFNDLTGITKSYEAVTKFCGFDYIDAGKTMGLSSYGKYDPNLHLYYGDEANKNIFQPAYPAGAVMNPKHFDEDLPLEQKYDVAKTIQEDTTDAVKNMISYFIKDSGIKDVVLSGGFALNCVGNYKYLDVIPEDGSLYVDPIASDAGTSIGLAKWMYYNKMREKFGKTYFTQNPRKYPLESLYLGTDYTLSKEQQDKGASVAYTDVAKLIDVGNIVAIFDGGSEAGPRALGNRSILYDPRDEDAQEIVNLVKNREYFRPFAASVLEDKASEYFDMKTLKSSPEMMYAVDVLENAQKSVSGITHVDGTCRIQTVNKEQNKHYYELIKAFDKLTGIPMVLNTSFNLAGEPMVETPEDAFDVLNRSGINYLYFPQYDLIFTPELKEENHDDQYSS